MKNRYSFWSTIFIGFVLIVTRIFYLSDDNKTFNPLTWDAFGYYIYLPGTFIYEDVTDLKWFPEIEKEYHVTGGGNLYQAHQQESDKYVFKYLGGVAIMQSPFFLIGHLIAKNTTYKADGFSLPYQYSIVFGAVLYAILGLFLLRVVLLSFFDDKTVAITLVTAFLATNFIQYVAIDCALSHAFVFPLYVFLLFFTMKWHQKPKVLWALLAGLLIGLATISRPTEAIMVLIPIFWATHNKAAAKLKWDLVKKHKTHAYAAALMGFIGILPQLIYWKMSTGSFIYDVGSKWSFLSPFFRVLFGWEKGWFIYTPITLFFVIGFFFMKKFPFKKAVLIYCLLNIYIVISWYIWRYGASYSTRALVQSYPVFVLAFAAFVHYIRSKKWRFLFYGLAFYLIMVNFFQIWQYNKSILHFDDMNRKYYSRIYLNPYPDALDMSLLDTDEWIGNEKRYHKENIIKKITAQNIQIPANSTKIIFQTEIPKVGIGTEQWLKIECSILGKKGLWKAYLKGSLGKKENKIRLSNPITKQGQINDYAFYFKIPTGVEDTLFKLSIDSNSAFVGKFEKLRISYFK